MSRRLRSIQDVLKADLCISCGACAAVTPSGAIRMRLDESQGRFIPELLSGQGKELAFIVCPGKGVPLQAISHTLFGDAFNVTFELGRYRRIVAAHSTDDQIRQNASSGGVMTEVAAYLLDHARVDGVLVSEYTYGCQGPRATAKIARTRESLLAAQGSKYCPTNTNSLIPECLRSGGRYLFSGTPCQVAALRLAIRQDPQLSRVFPLTMSNFCGGYRDYRNLNQLIRRHNMDPAQVVYFRFRGGGQPGSMKARDWTGREVTEPYPDYGRQSVVPKQKRCTFCLDATGELADFACGDAWIPRLMNKPIPWSIVLTRSAAADDILADMIEEKRLVFTDVSFDEVVKSQWHNLDSKKYRQKKRMQVCSLVGITLPEWDTSLPTDTGSYWQELRILLGKLRSSIRTLLGRTFLKKSSKT